MLVGVLDDGVKTVSELSGQISSLSRDFGTVTQNGVTTKRNVVGDDWSDHGTMVAGVIAARNDGTGVQGIAPGAQIVALRISEVDLDESDPELAETLGINMAEALRYAARNGIKVVNASIAKIDPTVRSTYWSQMVADYAASGGLFVNAAGNESLPDADGYLDLTAANRDGWLFVVALEGMQTSYELTDYSNQCGATAMDRCVAAMGTNASQDVDGNLVWFSGTSSATPQVSGLAALILGKWPQLSGIEAGEVILATARDIGAKGVDPVFGHGLIDVRAALSPVNPQLSNGVVQTALATSVLVLPDAVSGAAAVAALSDVTVLDAFGRDFEGDISGRVARSAAAPRRLERQLAMLAGGGSTSLATPDLRASAGFASLRNGSRPEDRYSRLTSGQVAWRSGGTWFSAGYRSSDAVADEFMGLAPSADALRAYAPLADTSLGAQRRLGGGELGFSIVQGGAGALRSEGFVASWRKGGTGLRAGMVDERGALFGTPTGSGALRLGDGARSWFVEASQEARLGDWSLAGYASLGVTGLRLSSDMLLTDADGLVTHRFGVTATRALGGGLLRLGLAQPLTVIRGRGTYTLGSGYDLEARALVYDRRRFDMAGGIDPLFSLGFETGGPGSQLRLAASARGDLADAALMGTWRQSLR